MSRSIQCKLFFFVLIAVASTAPLAWAGHGHGGGHGHSGGHSHFSGHSNFGGHGHSGFGGLSFNSHYGAFPYYYRPNYYYRPYPRYYYYGSYPYRYYSNNACDCYSYSGGQPQPDYTVSRPVANVARVFVRLPDAEGKIWVEGERTSGAGTFRRFNSPVLDPSTKYVYTIKAEWNENGRLVTEERKISISANSFAFADFGRPKQILSVPSGDRLADLPAPIAPIAE